MREGWEIKTIGEVCEIYNGGTPSTNIPEYWDGGIQWITPKDMGKSKEMYVSHCERTITQEGVEHSSAKVLPERSVIVSSRAPIGYVAINEVPMATNQGCKGFVLGKEIYPEFLYYFLLSSTELLNKLGTGATFKEVSGKKLAGIELPLPSLPEQQRIVDILDLEFAKIDALKANAEKSLYAAKDLFRHISNGYYNEPSPVSKLGDECIFVRGPFGGSLKKSCFVSSGYPVYEQQHAIYSTFTFRYFVNEEKYNEMKRFTTHPGDLIMSCSGTIGKVAIIPEDAPIGIINQALLKLTPKKTILPEYLKWYMQSISFEKDIQRHSKGAAIQNVASVAILKEIAIPVPTIEKQKQIVARLDDLNERCNALQENYQKTFALCDDLKQSLLRKAFNGEL